jgi:two-component system, sensor histidine kinase and response regulator
MTRVLVIDDEMMILENVLETLQLEGYEAFGAKNGLEGVEQAKRHLPDLILCDVMMPKMDGFTVLMHLRDEPATANTPFIFLTAKTDRADVRQGMELGASDYLTKPFTTTELIAAVKTQLEKHALLASAYENKLSEWRTNIFHVLPHELRTPLVALLGYSELMIMDADTLDSATVAEMAERIKQAGLRLHRTIENFLVHAQIEIISSDPSRIAALHNFSTNDADTLIAQIARQKAQEYQREPDLNLSLGETPALALHHDNLKKIVEELVDNAFKFSQPGTPVGLATDVADTQCTIRVSDRGRGLQPEHVTNIGAYVQFERKLYEQQGSGLGLIIAKRLTELHNGQFRLSSEAGEWTTVEVSLPCTA